MPLTCCIIRKPTSTSAGTAASSGIAWTTAVRRTSASRNSTPVTTEARPVRAPSPTPEADSMYEVFEETPAGAAGDRGQRVDDQDPLGVGRDALLVVAARPRRRSPSSCPWCRRSRRACSVKTRSRAAMTPIELEGAEAGRTRRACRGRVRRRGRRGSSGRSAPSPAGCRPPPMAASTMKATIAVTTIEIRIAALDAAHPQGDQQDQPGGEDEHRPARRARRRCRAAPAPWSARRRGCGSRTRVDEADQRR